MTSTPPSADSHLESLMRAGQDAMKQFDDALASAAGVRGKDANPSAQFFSPFGLIADLQHEYLKQLWRFWNTTFLRTIAEPARATLVEADKRFKDDAWNDQPYYELLKQSYLLGSRQLREFVERAQVDDRPNCNSVSMLASILMR